MDANTEDDSESGRYPANTNRPGMVIVWSGMAPVLLAHRINRELAIGRDLAGIAPTDDRISRRHAKVVPAEGGLLVSDLDSRNGTFLDGERIERERWVHPPAILRMGRTIAVLVRDVGTYLTAKVTVEDGVVVGPALREAWTRIERAARGGDGLLLLGESGAGKELAARVFHAATGHRKELVAVNCATIPAGVAERLLFGTRRGAYSGADRDADGYLVAADGGTIFLDEIAELDLGVQAKLLRVLETREVMPLGAAHPRTVDIRIVAATLRELRVEVAERRFREDLYHRVGRPEVRLPALRDRPEEIPWLIANAFAQVAPALAPHPALLEQCLLRPWPGNVRELAGEVRRAAMVARDAKRTEVRVQDLAPDAGLRIAAPAPAATPAVAAAKPAALPDDATIERALAAEQGNVTRAAKALGLHRNQLRRFLARRGG